MEQQPLSPSSRDVETHAANVEVGLMATNNLLHSIQADFQAAREAGTPITGTFIKWLQANISAQR